jgi:tryptophanyl-tRNA synthetase
MAADILLYDAEVVPVESPLQHLEPRDVAHDSTTKWEKLLSFLRLNLK